jgi:hypothetical protein
VPTLTDTSYQNPSRVRAGARRVAPAHPLGYTAELLERRLGKGVMDSWFPEVGVTGVIDGTLTLSTVSPFNRDWLATNTGLVVEDCWNKANPAQQVDRVEFIVIKPEAKR